MAPPRPTLNSATRDLATGSANVTDMDPAHEAQVWGCAYSGIAGLTGGPTQAKNYLLGSQLGGGDVPLDFSELVVNEVGYPMALMCSVFVLTYDPVADAYSQPSENVMLPLFPNLDIVDIGPARQPADKTKIDFTIPDAAAHDLHFVLWQNPGGGLGLGSAQGSGLKTLAGLALDRRYYLVFASILQAGALRFLLGAEPPIGGAAQVRRKPWAAARSE